MDTVKQRKVIFSEYIISGQPTKIKRSVQGLVGVTPISCSFSPFFKELKDGLYVPIPLPVNLAFKKNEAITEYLIRVLDTQFNVPGIEQERVFIMGSAKSSPIIYPLVQALEEKFNFISFISTYSVYPREGILHSLVEIEIAAILGGETSTVIENTVDTTRTPFIFN